MSLSSRPFAFRLPAVSHILTWDCRLSAVAVFHSTHVTFSEQTHKCTSDHKTADKHDNITFLAPRELPMLEVTPIAQDLSCRDVVSAPSREPHRNFKVTNDNLWNGGENRGIPKDLSRTAAGKDEEDSCRTKTATADKRQSGVFRHKKRKGDGKQTALRAAILRRPHQTALTTNGRL